MYRPKGGRPGGCPRLMNDIDSRAGTIYNGMAQRAKVVREVIDRERQNE